MYQTYAHATLSSPEQALPACAQTHATHSAGHQHHAGRWAASRKRRGGAVGMLNTAHGLLRQPCMNRRSSELQSVKSATSTQIE
eukprot:5502165-Pleurochrysis_carterae.AAC.2